MSLIRSMLRKVGFLHQIKRGFDLVKADQTSPQIVLPGHFYSPIPEQKNIWLNRDSIFDRSSDHIPGIKLNDENQRKLLEEFEVYYSELPFAETQKETDSRYYYKNSMFHHADAVILYSMLRHFKPKKVVEVGSGFSSALMLDVNDLFLEKKTKMTFIEPYPERLNSLLHARDDGKNVTILEQPVQEVDLAVFESLEANDILFIDSSHISKIGSDVNFLFFEILPRLKAGVIIHVHDIHYPFEYREDWVKAGYAWNEAYLLRAFLQFNECFDILMYNNYVERFHQDWIHKHMPKVLAGEGWGSSLWLIKSR